MRASPPTTPPLRPWRQAPAPCATVAALVVTAGLVGVGCGAPGTGDPGPDPDPDPVGPTAVIEGELTGTSPFALALDASSSEAGDSPIVSWRWTLDGEDAGAEATLARVVLVEGEHRVELTVTDEAGLSGGASATVLVEAEPCPSFAAGTQVGSLGPVTLGELSGLVASRRQDDVLWGHNDSGDYPDIYALHVDGSRIGQWEVQGAQAYDWEDIALGPGPDDGVDYLYVGDIGDNNYVRSSIRVYRLPEPDIATAGPDYVPAFGAETFTFTYPGGADNAEAMFVDPRTGDLFILTKDSVGPTRVFRRPAPLSNGPLEQVGSFRTGTSLSAALVTAADVTPLGNQILVRSYDNVHVFLRRGGGSVADAFAEPSCSAPIRVEPQGESIAFLPDGRSYVTSSEGAGSPIYRFDRDD